MPKGVQKVREMTIISQTLLGITVVILGKKGKVFTERAMKALEGLGV
jgi:hypothetical protein